MTTEANRAKAEAGLLAISQAVEAEVRAAGEDGLRNDQVAKLLGLQTSVGEGQRNHLTHAVLNRLVATGALKRESRGVNVFYLGI